MQSVLSYDCEYFEDAQKGLENTSWICGWHYIIKSQVPAMLLLSYE